MWTRSIEVPSTSFPFETEALYPQSINIGQAQYVVLNDGAVLRPIVPKLEDMYSAVFKAAESYLNPKEIASVSAQAMELRKKGGISIPK
jgi:hypothetical protein